VTLCRVDIDMTGFSKIVLNSGQSIKALPGCERGLRSLGSRIYVRDKRDNEALFEIHGDNVTISGFRLQGPTNTNASGATKDVGISVLPEKSATPISKIEILNMEIFYWAHAGVLVGESVELSPRGRLSNGRPGAVRISNNYIHHNRHEGLGYGVNTQNGAYTLIEKNVFDGNRHAIAADSKNQNGLDYTGYTAQENLILSGGGLACGFAGICWDSHQIDMHGDGGGSHQCGTAGETIIIKYNTILYNRSGISAYAIKIRGNPVDKAVVDGNVFKYGSQEDAIIQYGNCGWIISNITNPIIVTPNNRYGVNPMAKLGNCSFFGDGRQDEFMATGVTWWVRSAVTGQWRYLNTKTEGLNNVLLGDYDGDGKCDVALKHRNPAMSPVTYSKGGDHAWASIISRVVQ